MTKILHTADWHLGAPNTPKIYHDNVVRLICELAKKEGCEYVLVAGDIFDRPRPDQQIKDFLVKQLLEHIGGLNFIFSVGNHDYTNKAQDYHSLEYLKHLYKVSQRNLNIHVLEPGHIVIGDEIIFSCLSALKMYEVPPADKKKKHVMVWHGTVPGLNYTTVHVPDATKESIESIIKASKANYLALGDIHKHKKVTDKCWYPGPPVQKTYTDTCGLLCVDLDENTVTSHKLDLPQRVVVNIEWTDRLEKSGKKSKAFMTETNVVDLVKQAVDPGNFVKIKFELPLSVWREINQTMIREMLADYCLEVRLDNVPIPEKKDIEYQVEMKKAKTIPEELDVIIDKEDFGVNKKALKNFFKKYVTV
jgi:DNA repair exonuclease SbcCD nuclease subunit